MGQLLLVLLAALIYLGVAQRVLDRMRLTDTTALLLLGAMFIAPFLPNVNIGGGLRMDLAGTLIPLGIIVYLVATADQTYERVRAVIATVVTGAAVFATEQLLPAEPTGSMPIDLDPLWAAGIIAGIVGYLSGRSRRAAFVAGVGGIVFADLIATALLLMGGIRGTFNTIGGGGAFDGIVIAGTIAVALAEIVGETREYLARRGGTRTGAGTKDAEADRGGATQVQSSTLGIATLGVALAATLVLTSGPLADRLHGPYPPQHEAGRHYRMESETGELLLVSGFPITIGDRWIDADNNLFEVIQLRGDVAIGRELGPISLVQAGDAEQEPAESGRPPLQRAGLIDWLAGRIGLGTNRATSKHTAVIVHSHNDESYLVPDGTESTEGAGGIHEVGKQLADHLEKHGLNVIHDETLHLPHDRGAYRRSRRTIIEHFSDNPATVLDVHRDAVPDPEFYAFEHNGEGVTKIRVVVGRQNPNRNQNLQFAKQLKAIADEQYPGLFHGIFEGRGNYNQDLGPRVILFEMGTHTNARQSAERAAQLLADVLATYFAQPEE